MFDRRFGGLGQILYTMVVRLLTFLYGGITEKHVVSHPTRRSLRSPGWIAWLRLCNDSVFLEVRQLLITRRCPPLSPQGEWS